MRRIKKARIQFISLVPRGANRMPVIYKADGTAEFATLIKASDDAGELLAVVYAPEKRDTQGDIADAAVIKEMAYEALRKGGPEVDIRHDGKAVGRDRAYVAESFLVAKGDTRFEGWKDHDGNDAGDLTGAWANVIKIDDPEIRALVKSGEIGAVSMAGTAVVEQEKADDAPPSWFQKLFGPLFKGRTDDTQDDDEMKPDEIKALVKEVAVEVAKALKPEAPAVVETPAAKAETQAPAATAAATPPATVEEPAFKGDISDPKAVAEHLKGLEKAALAKDVDWKDPTSVKTYLEKLSALEGDAGEEAEDVAKDEDEDGETTSFEKRLAALEGKSKQPAKVGKAADPRAARFANLAKEDVAEGLAMADLINAERGYAKA